MYTHERIFDFRDYSYRGSLVFQQGLDQKQVLSG